MPFAGKGFPRAQPQKVGARSPLQPAVALATDHQWRYHRALESPARFEYTQTRLVHEGSCVLASRLSEDPHARPATLPTLGPLAFQCSPCTSSETRRRQPPGQILPSLESANALCLDVFRGEGRGSPSRMNVMLYYYTRGESLLPGRPCELTVVLGTPPEVFLFLPKCLLNSMSHVSDDATALDGSWIKPGSSTLSQLPAFQRLTRHEQIVLIPYKSMWGQSYSQRERHIHFLIALLRPKSAGSIRLLSRNPPVYPDVEPGYLFNIFQMICGIPVVQRSYCTWKISTAGRGWSPALTWVHSMAMWVWFCPSLLFLTTAAYPSVLTRD